MKSLTRAIIVVAIANLVTGTFAVAQEASEDKTLTISGSVGLSGVRMLGLPGNPVTDESGYYSATVPYSFTGTAKPPKEGFTFEPATMIYRKITNNRDNQNYVPKMITFIISGTTGLSGVMMDGLPGNPVTGRNGTYQATVPYGFSGTVKPTKEGYAFEPPGLSYSRVIRGLTNQNYNPKRLGPAPILRQTGRRKVLVIPAAEVEAEDLVEIIEDMHVMSHILDERFEEPRTIKGLFTDFGDFFGRDNRATEAIYLQGYGILFLMEVNFTLSPPPQPQEQEAKKTEEYVDPTWQRAKQKIFSPKDPMMSMGDVSEQESGMVKVEELKTELTEALRHAANIRDLKPDEWVILTVIGGHRELGGVFSNKLPMSGGMSMSKTSAYAGASSGRMDGFGSSFGGGYSAGGYGGGMSVSMGGVHGGGMGGYGGMSFSSATVLTIRAKKLDVDAYAGGELDFEQFRQKAKMFMY